MLDDGLSTVSTQDQGDLEKRVLHIYRQAYADGQCRGGDRLASCKLPAAAQPPPLAPSNPSKPPPCPVLLLHATGFDPEDEGLLLDRALHAAYLCGGLGELPAGADAFSWPAAAASSHRLPLL